MSALERKFYPIQTSINVKIILPGIFGYRESISLYYNQTLNKQFKSFLLKNSVKLKAGYYFYLKKEEKILKSLPKNKTVKELNLHPNDIILVTYEKQIKSQLIDSTSNIVTSKECMSDIENLAKKLGNQNPIIYPREKSKEINDFQKDMRKKKKI